MARYMVRTTTLIRHYDGIDKLKELIQGGGLRPDDKVRTLPDGDWTRAADHPELKGAWPRNAAPQLVVSASDGNIYSANNAAELRHLAVLGKIDAAAQISTSDGKQSWMAQDHPVLADVWQALDGERDAERTVFSGIANIVPDRPVVSEAIATLAHEDTVAEPDADTAAPQSVVISSDVTRGNRHLLIVLAAILMGIVVLLGVVLFLVLRGDAPSEGAAAEPRKPPLYPIVEQGKWGYIDGLGTTVVVPRFERARVFWEAGPDDRSEFAIVQLSGLCGFINRAGEIAVEPSYDECGEMFEGLAPVRQGDSWGYIDTGGHLVVAPQFDGAKRMSEGKAAVEFADVCGYVDHDGKLTINPQFDACDRFSGGHASVRVGNRWGYIDHDGNYTINPQYKAATPFDSERAMVKVENRWGAIDQEGSVVVNPTYERAFAFREQRAAVLVDDKWGFVDHDGEVVVRPQFEEADFFANGLAAVRVGGRWGYIDLEGKFRINPQFDSATVFYGELAIVGRDGVISWINHRGDVVWTHSGVPEAAEGDEGAAASAHEGEPQPRLAAAPQAPAEEAAIDRDSVTEAREVLHEVAKNCENMKREIAKALRDEGAKKSEAYKYWTMWSPNADVTDLPEVPAQIVEFKKQVAVGVMNVVQAHILIQPEPCLTTLRDAAWKMATDCADTGRPRDPDWVLTAGQDECGL